MASIRTETLISAHLAEAWAALRDWGALHKRLAPGFITDLTPASAFRRFSATQPTLSLHHRYTEPNPAGDQSTLVPRET